VLVLLSSGRGSSAGLAQRRTTSSKTAEDERRFLPVHLAFFVPLLLGYLVFFSLDYGVYMVSPGLT
jgi:hypothetical protein